MGGTKVSKMVNVECASELAARTGTFTELLSRCDRWIPKLCEPMLRESPPGRPYTSNWHIWYEPYAVQYPFSRPIGYTREVRA